MSPYGKARTIKLRPALPGGYRPKSLKQTSAVTPELMATLGFPTEYVSVPRSSPRYPDHRVLGRVIEPPALPNPPPHLPRSFQLPTFLLKRPKLALFWPQIRLVRPNWHICVRPLVLMALGCVGFVCFSALAIGATLAYHRVEQSRALATMAKPASEASVRISYLEWEAQHLNRSLHALEQQDSRLHRLLAEKISTVSTPILPPLSPDTRENTLSSIPSIDPTNGGQLTSGYGWRTNPWPEFHRGVDLAEPEGYPVMATAEGTVQSAGWNGGFGNLVDIDHHNGYHTYYAHLSRINVQTGEHVYRGEVIAAVGQTGEATGPHLHYQIMHMGVSIDPTPFMHGARRPVASL